MSVDRKVFSEEEIRAACNEDSPQEAFVIAITLLQRLTVGIEALGDPMIEGRQLFGESKSQQDFQSAG